ncbi:hypothetical protein [Rhodococcus sp. X156]|uniref:hypothetical protein n=1 Tax=Rhodococcus sp. X156 TaxID=2499145 RepID=UPI000FD71F19|nr:hypothetical protein [Rhodococcus sp. X156]
MLVGLLCALLACISYGTSSVLQAYAARRSAARAKAQGATNQATSSGAPTLAATLAAVLSFWYVAGTLLDVLGFASNAVSARLIPLFLSQTIMSSNLVVTALLAVVVLHTRLYRRDWVAIAVVVASLLALGVSAGKEGGGDVDPVLHWSLLGIAVALLVIGQLTVRRLGSRGSIAAGLFAGLGFGVLAIAVRVTEGLDPLDVPVLLSDPASWTIALGGIGGYYLFTVALQLGSVTGATAALVVGETVIPGVVGVWLLGDAAKPGLQWLAALGFVFAVVGAVAVAVFGNAEAEGGGATEPGGEQPAPATG